MYSYITIGILAALAIFLFWRLAVSWDRIALLDSQEVHFRSEAERYRKFHVDALQVSAGHESHAKAVEDANAEQRDKIISLEQQLAAAIAKATRKPARIMADNGMSEEAIAETLRGTESSAITRAVCAKITATIVALSDRATDAPRETVTTGKGEVIVGYSNDQRLHDAGGVAHLAELLADLQETTKTADEKNSSAAA